jgi:hypothetical protein
MSSIPQQSLDRTTEAYAGSKPSYTLYDARAVALATFFGTPIAGGILLALNYRRLGWPARAVNAVVLTVIGTGLVILIGWKIPQGLSTFIALGLMFAMKGLAKSLQGHAITEHVESGGALGSMWRAFWLGLVVLVVLFGTVVLAVYLKDRLPRVVIGSKDGVYYSGSATKEEAQSLGNALKTSGYFSDKGVDVVLDKGKDGTSVSFVVKEGAWNNIASVEQFEIIGQQIAPAIGGYPIEVHLANKNRDIETDSNVGRVAVNSKDHVYYFGSATETGAQALGEALTKAGFFDGKGSDVFLSKHSDGTMLSFVVADGVWNDPALVKQFETMVSKVAPAIGGTPIRLRLVTTSLEVKKDEML